MRPIVFSNCLRALRGAGIFGRWLWLLSVEFVFFSTFSFVILFVSN